MEWLLREADDPQAAGGNSEGRPERIFLHNPLHDYESVWWIAIWVLFRCKPESLNSEEPEDSQMRAMEEIFGKHRTTVMIASGPFNHYKKFLPDILHPLFEILEAFRGVLIMAYQDYERSFDGSSILSKAEHFHRCLGALANRADKVKLCDFPLLPTLQPPPLDRSLVIPEESSEGSSTEGRGAGGDTSDRRPATMKQNQEETTEELGTVAGHTKWATRDPEDETLDVFLSAPTSKEDSFPKKFGLLPLPNKRKASISSISEQPSRRTKVFDNNLGHE